MGKKRPGFADVQTTRRAFGDNELRCPNCNRHVGATDNPRYVGTVSGEESTLATLTCGRCRTMLSIRFVAEEQIHPD